MFAPLITPGRLAAFGRDPASAKQVWSRHEGYPGDPRYRDFYRDIGFDLDLDYVRPNLSAPEHRGFTGLKYHRITGGAGPKAVYDRALALKAAEEHASHFVAQRARQAWQLSDIMGRPPVLVAPYDAELFGHWWYEGPEFLDFVARKAPSEAPGLRLTTPGAYLAENPTQQLATPAPSSWGEGGYWKIWLNESNEWVYRSLQPAQQQMTLLANSHVNPTPVQARALKQAGRELLLTQASDWPFILRAGTSPAYAEHRVKSHLERFNTLATSLLSGKVDEGFLARAEEADGLFSGLDWQAWRTVEP
jgi:1,4-alpha-glucan branching enzyme